MILESASTSKSFEVTIPGKTFLVGEYLALNGGPSIVACTRPTFRFRWTIKFDNAATREDVGTQSQIDHSFHADSPAGKLLDKLASERVLGRDRAVIEFHDPHYGKGGLGASTAEFLGAWLFQKWVTEFGRAEIDDHRDLVETAPNHLGEVFPHWKSDRLGSAKFRDLLESYRNFVDSGSGADLVSQAAGGIAVWDGTEDRMRKFAWPWDGLAMSLLKTGRKLQTHQYLAQSVQGSGLPLAGAVSASSAIGFKPLEADFVRDMREWVEEATQALALADADRFVAAVRGTARSLLETGRVAQHTEAVLAELAQESSIRAAKGCGAMGSDVILVLHDGSEKSAAVISDIQGRHELELAATEQDLHMSGLQLFGRYEAELGKA